MIKNTTIELLLIAGGGGGGAANLTSSTGDSINARGLVDPFKFEGNAKLIPTFDTDAGITDDSFYYRCSNCMKMQSADHFTSILHFYFQVQGEVGMTV